MADGVTYYGRMTTLLPGEIPRRQPLWQGPYHPSWPPKPGSWVMWVMPDFVKVGQVEMARGISAVILFQGNDIATHIPDAYQYWDPTPDTPAPVYTLCPTHEPRIKVEAAGDRCSVRQAAAKLGKNPKDIRRMLRAGQLTGRQEAGLWVEVDLASLNRAQRHETSGTD